MKINAELLKTLDGLKNDPTLVISAYQQLFTGDFWVITQKNNADLHNNIFLSYPTADGIREIPVFTTPDRDLIPQLCAQLEDFLVIKAEGETLWPRMLEIVNSGELEVAVDPGETHGIRLSREIILSMVKMQEK